MVLAGVAAVAMLGIYGTAERTSRERPPLKEPDESAARLRAPAVQPPAPERVPAKDHKHGRHSPAESARAVPPPHRRALPVRAPEPLPAEAAGTRFAELRQAAPELNPRALEKGLAALHNLETEGMKVRSDVLGIIDYSLPSTVRRFWVLDLRHDRLLFHELVAHGKNSGNNRATRFSNASGSLMSSLGVFLTTKPYMGEHGLSLRLEGLDKGENDNCLRRAIVIHPANYVSEALARKMGRIGRSWGCPAVRPTISRQLIRTLEGGAVLLAYYPHRG